MAQGTIYPLLMIFLRNTRIYFLKTKDQVFRKFKEWKLMIEKNRKNIKYLRIDSGLEFCEEDFRKKMELQA